MSDETATQTIAQFNANRTGQTDEKLVVKNTVDVKDKQVTTDTDLIKAKSLETKENLRKQKLEDAAAAAKEKEQEERDANTLQQTQNAAKGVQEGLINTTKPAVQWLANLPTPGGIGLLLVIIGIFVMAIIPIDNNGNTRLKLLWLTLTGKTHLMYEEGGGASGTFASGGTPFQQTQLLPGPINNPVTPPIQPLSTITTVTPNNDNSIQSIQNNGAISNVDWLSLLGLG